jgi:chromosome partitioning protein
MSEVLAILSRKGGVGKTHTSIHAAAILKKRRKDVAVLDLDPEGSAASWSRQKNALPFPVYTARQRDEASKHGYLVIDTPPNDSRTLGEAARLATRVVVVAGADGLEADRLVPTLEALAASGFQGKWGILLNRVPRGNLGPAMQSYLEGEELPVLGLIPDRAEYHRVFGENPGRLDEYEAALRKVLG